MEISPLSNQTKRHSVLDRTADNRTAGRPMLDTLTQERIGTRLRELYDHLAEQPIPAFLLDILERPSSIQRVAVDTGRTAKSCDNGG